LDWPRTQRNEIGVSVPQFKTTEAHPRHCKHAETLLLQKFLLETMNSACNNQTVIAVQSACVQHSSTRGRENREKRRMKEKRIATGLSWSESALAWR
jgi:hypothetical protein